MLRLSGFASSANIDPSAPRSALRLVTAPTGQAPNPDHDAYLFRGDKSAPDCRWVVTFEEHQAEAEEIFPNRELIVLPEYFSYLSDGDVIRFGPDRKAVRVLFRKEANANYFLVTERCNHLCLMCSQPPKDVDDHWLAREIVDVLPLLPTTTPFLGITGGEPTLVGEDFFEILSCARDHLPSTPIHILSNGRTFKDRAFAQRYRAIGHPRLSVGIPIYSADPEVHDFVVQSKGAFDETIRGIMNLKAVGAEVEIRVVVHKQTYEGLVDLSDFIFRNLTFVDHVTFMGLEITGFTRANMDKLWMDPYDYRNELRAAVQYLAAARINVSVYNHQLCLLDRSLHGYAKRSISDWKNEYVDECTRCSRRDECGGFFSSSSLARSSHISAFQ
ncbi:His-Xaa-Ser system radical SAM maturase HxsC [Mesorhizobium sp. M2E.F.Ca.ET.209.01.1.1]|uniref:His-Xaa-Ser system radical SAM maturase HxsC n=1 Tax=Mesorhizobium sp. M2E.F.Ca.ET.209.01.1.1 TaxID=2500526 RepID=UPI000FD954BB|nr:His-Xaa-Ser system radical SAM maturase HxsC [Mesorhizobium sp. M2E.F.Ca.ET.209.01.1.1]TGS19035.1 His-Xaa-Ser system radical SAM maturase HxsC [Mesorhizobium sp. M2E.F.Ca.ET.209.01.1.1]